MVDPLSFALTQATLAIRTVDGSIKLADRANDTQDSDPGKVYDMVRKLKNDRAYLSPSTPFDGAIAIEKSKEKDAVESSAVRAIQSLFENPIRKGVVNVLFDEPGTGKSMAGISFFSDYYLLPGGRNIQGFMVSTQASSGLYVENLAEMLKATKVKGWFHALLLGMDEPKEELPSLLILDDFSLDAGGKNLEFMEHLYKSMNPPNAPKKNIIVVVMTQNRDAADALCRLNGGRRVRPISGFYNNREHDIGHKVLTATKMRDPQHVLTHPTWKSSQWTTDLLIQVLRYHFSESELEQIQNYDFVKDGDNPVEVLQEAESRLLASKAGRPTSPRRQGQFGFESTTTKNILSRLIAIRR